MHKLLATFTSKTLPFITFSNSIRTLIETSRSKETTRSPNLIRGLFIALGRLCSETGLKPVNLAAGIPTQFTPEIYNILGEIPGSTLKQRLLDYKGAPYTPPQGAPPIVTEAASLLSAELDLKTPLPASQLFLSKSADYSIAHIKAVVRNHVDGEGDILDLADIKTQLPQKPEGDDAFNGVYRKTELSTFLDSSPAKAIILEASSVSLGDARLLKELAQEKGILIVIRSTREEAKELVSPDDYDSNCIHVLDFGASVLTGTGLSMVLSGNANFTERYGDRISHVSPNIPLSSQFSFLEHISNRHLDDLALNASVQLNLLTTTAKESAARELSTHGLEVSAEHVHLSNGASGGLFLLAQSLSGEYGELSFLAPEPYFVPQQGILGAGGCQLGGTPCSGSYFTLEDLKGIQTDFTGLLLTTPSNPAGNIIPITELKRILSHCEEQGIHVAFDDTYFNYAPAAYKSAFSNLLNTYMNEDNRVYVVRSYSKGEGVCAERMGAIITRHTQINEMLTQVQDDEFDDQPTLPSLTVLIEALERTQDTGEGSHVATSNALMEANRAYATTQIQLPGGFSWMVKDKENAAGVYIYLNFPDSAPSLDVLDFMMKEGVVFLPGEIFSESSYGARLSLCTPDTDTFQKNMSIFFTKLDAYLNR